MGSTNVQTVIRDTSACCIRLTPIDEKQNDDLISYSTAFPLCPPFNILPPLSLDACLASSKTLCVLRRAVSSSPSNSSNKTGNASLPSFCLIPASVVSLCTCTPKTPRHG